MRAREALLETAHLNRALAFYGYRLTIEMANKWRMHLRFFAIESLRKQPRH
jgi:hypothetical protein